MEEYKWFFVGKYGRYTGSKQSYWVHEAFWDTEKDIVYRVKTFKREQGFFDVIAIWELQSSGAKLKRNDLKEKVLS